MCTKIYGHYKLNTAPNIIKTSFIHISALKEMIVERRKNNSGWPHCLIKVKAKKENRPDIDGPFSIFTNTVGQTYCAIAGHAVRVDQSTYFITNQYQPYSLRIHSETPVETCNIHFSDTFIDQAEIALAHLQNDELDPISSNVKASFGFFNKLYRKDRAFNFLVSEIIHFQSGLHSIIDYEEKLFQLYTYLRQGQNTINREIQDLTQTKYATKKEIYKRLNLVTDYMHSNFEMELDLDKLAAVACLSKFHFIRLFKQVYCQSPHQYLIALRLNKAKHLLRHSNFPITQIAFATGFQNLSSFSRAFYNRLKIWPQHYRKALL